MAKVLKETPVFFACPACRKVQRAKLKWAKNHKALRCKDCKETIDLKAKAAKRTIAATIKAVESFENALKVLRKQATAPNKKRHQASRNQTPRHRRPRPAALPRPVTPQSVSASPLPSK
jgi:transcription elongation factor Elf1